MNPAAERQGFRRGLGLALLLLALASVGAAPLDRLAFDGTSRFLRRREGQRGVVLVGVDEATERAYPEPLALWHRHLGAVFQALAQAGPRAVGVDLNLPTRSFDATLPGGDAALLAGIVRLRRAAPLVLGITVDADGQARPLHKPFQTVAGAEGIGLVQWEVDPDGVVRRFTEHPHGRREAVPTLVGQLARALRLPVREGLLDYRFAPAVPYVPIQQVEAWGRDGRLDELQRAFQDKVVLVGSVLPFVDRHFQVVDLNGWGEDNRRFAPGALLHAQALENLLGRGPIRTVPLPGVLLLDLGLLLLGLGLGGRARAGGCGALAAVGALGGAQVALQGAGWFLPPASPAMAVLIGYGVRFGLGAWAARQLAARFERAFRGLVSPPVLAKIKAGAFLPGLEGETARLCVLFSDVRGYTTLSEGRDPREIIRILNRYFDRMVPAIHAHGGAVDCFMGDGIMAHFGHPEPLANACQAAFEASRDMLAALALLNRELGAEGVPGLRIGIGLHAGEALVGNIGSRDRHDYSAIGDTVNVASRTEGLTKEAGYPLVLTEAVARDLEDRAALVDLGPRPIKGHTDMHVFGWRQA
jgi:class 3 adenylate cyclase/CHASE2 domain-containing sensor protein